MNFSVMNLIIHRKLELAQTFKSDDFSAIYQTYVLRLANAVKNHPSFSTYILRMAELPIKPTALTPHVELSTEPWIVADKNSCSLPQ